MHSINPRASGDLTDLPNISFVLAEELRRVGIRSPYDLANVGAEIAWGRLRAAGKRYDPQTLLALEGAIRGIPWQDLPSFRRVELRRLTAV